MHLGLNHWKDHVVLVGHDTSSNTIEGREERSSLDVGGHSWAFNLAENQVDGSDSDLLHVGLEVGVLEVLNLVQHREGSSVERSLGVELGVGEEVDEGSLLNILVFLVNSVILQLLLSVSQVLVLNHLGGISPHVGQLSELVLTVDIVENGELWTDEVGEVSNLNVTKIVSKEELMMPDHGSEPVVVFPTTESRDGVDGGNVGSEENKSSSGSRECLVMWGNLLWTNSLEQILQVVQVGHVDWGSIAVIWMNIADLHVIESRLVVVGSTVLSLVLNIRTKHSKLDISSLTYTFC